jgi:hypothetical protein
MATVGRCDIIRSQRGSVPAFGGASIWFLCWGPRAGLLCCWLLLLLMLVFSVVSLPSEGRHHQTETARQDLARR